MPKKKKNQRATQEPTDDTPAEELKHLREQNAQLMTRLDKLMAKLEKYESTPPETPTVAATQAVKAKAERAPATKLFG